MHSVWPRIGRVPRRKQALVRASNCAGLIMINFSMGDRADFLDRSCGCPLEALGWKPQLCNVRSYEKLTAGGATFYDADVIRVLEEVLPARFGGAPPDYQLLEEETEVGHPVLKLVVHPRLGEIDQASLAHAFLEAMGGGSSLDRMMSSVLRDGVHFEVKTMARG